MKTLVYAFVCAILFSIVACDSPKVLVERKCELIKARSVDSGVAGTTCDIENCAYQGLIEVIVCD